MAAEQTWPGGIILAALPAKSFCMTLDEVAEATGFERGRITDLIYVMKRQGLVLALHEGCWARTPEGDKAIETPRTGRARKPRQTARRVRADSLPARIWRALRILKRASFPELLEIADAHGSAGTSGRTYLQVLERYGVVAVSGRTKKSDRNRQVQQYILVQNIGPLAPFWQRQTSKLFDPNKRVEMPLPVQPEDQGHG